MSKKKITLSLISIVLAILLMTIPNTVKAKTPLKKQQQKLNLLQKIKLLLPKKLLQKNLLTRNLYLKKPFLKK